MTEKDAIEELELLYAKRAGDDEAIHSFEDEILLQIIRSFGWIDFVKKYESAEHSRWCA